jgi:hypothetical protein
MGLTSQIEPAPPAAVPPVRDPQHLSRVRQERISGLLGTFGVIGAVIALLVVLVFVIVLISHPGAALARWPVCGSCSSWGS